MSSTEAQNGFGRLLDAIAKDTTVFIKKRDVTQAVMMSVERYESLSRSNSPTLDVLTAEFDEMLSRMQTGLARSAHREAFALTPEELGRAAVEASGGSGDAGR